MGTTCANLHIFVKDRSAQSPEAVGHRLTSACDKLGFESSAPEDADLRLVVSSGGDWLTIHIDGQAGILTETDLRLAAEISSDAKSPVLVTSLYDSDEFAYLLFDKGKQIDGYTTSAGIVPAKVRRSSVKKRPELWSRVFKRDFSSDQIESIVVAKSAFADEHLDRLCDVVQLPPSQSRLGSADHDPTVSLLQVSTFRRRRGDATVRQTGGVSDFEKDESRRDLYVGELTRVSFEISADVAALADPVLELTGSAVAGQIVEIPKVGGLWHCGLQHVTRHGVRQFEATLAGAEEGAIRAATAELSPVI